MNILAKSAVVGSLLLCSGSEVTDTDYRFEQLTAISAEDEAALQATFNSLLAYWQSQGIGIDPELKIVKADEWADCAAAGTTYQVLGTELATALYCDDNDTVLITEGLVDTLMDGTALTGPQDIDVLKAVLAHEVGHGVQDVLGLLTKETYKDLGLRQNRELQADCLGGRGLEAVAPAAVPDSMFLYETYIGAASMQVGSQSSGGTHGTPVQRLESYEAGLADGDCGL